MTSRWVPTSRWKVTGFDIPYLDWDPVSKKMAKIEGAKVEDDGTVTLTVPATAEKGFMILKSKAAK